MKIDEYEPVSNPTSNASEKSRRVVAPRKPEPRTSSDSTGSTAAMLVLIERISTWFIDTLITSAYGTREPEKRSVFSLTLSNTTMVSYSEKPRIVRKATTVAGVTSNWNTEYTPTLINTSCNMAMMAAAAIRHSSRQAMNRATRIKKMTKARMAFSVMLRPHVELTELTLT